MRFVELSLIRFGPFTEHVLDLSSSGLHIFYGDNEAGKSTALRAVLGLLFGIPRDTPDAHLHRMPDLRIGARLAAADGSELALIRRKGNKNTLQAPDGSALDETLLTRLLGGVSQALFESMFGLTQQGLRKGAEDLLAGRGDIGESLFDASLGGRGIHRVLEELRSEAGKLFKAQGKTGELNVALKKYRDAERDRNQHRLRSKTWELQEKERRAASADRDRIIARRRELVGERERFKRIQKARKPVSRRADLLAERAELGDGPRLSDDFRERRERALGDLAQADRDLARIEGQIAARVEKRRALAHSERLAALDEARMATLREGLANYKKALVDLPKRRGELARCQGELRTILSRLGRAPDLAEVDGLRLSTETQARIGRLGRERAGLVTHLSLAQRELGKLEKCRADLERELEALPPRVEMADLERSLSSAQRAGDLEVRLQECARKQTELQARAERALGDLGSWNGSLEQLMSKAVPAVESVERFEAGFARLEQRAERNAEGAREVRARIGERTRQLEALKNAGAVPTENELADVRARRDAGWQLVRRAWKEGADVSAQAAEYDSAPLEQAFEAALSAADALADRLRRETQRVERHAGLEADLALAERDAEQVAVEASEIEAAQAALFEEWTAAWTATEISPLSPKEMRGWLERRRQLGTLAEQLAVLHTEERALRADCDAKRRALAAGLGDSETRDELLTVLIDRAERELEARRATERERAETQRKLESTKRDLAERQAELSEWQSKLQAWHRDWWAALAPLRLGADADPEEVSAVLKEIAELVRQAEEAERVRQRIQSMERDVAGFARNVEVVVHDQAPDLANLPCEEGARRLLDAFDDARQKRDKQRDLDRDLAESRAALAEATAARLAALADLEELMREAGASDRDTLQTAEDLFLRRRDVERRLLELEAELDDLREDLPLSVVVSEVQGVAHQTAVARLEEIERDVTDLDEELRGVDQRIGGIEQQLSNWNGESLAAEDAAQAQAHLARARSAAERYLRLQLAIAVLEREVERFREQGQGPLLQGASRLFRRLTLGRYAELVVEFDDEGRPVLRAEREDRTRVGIEGLSDGTRDQLYLALRLSSLERYAEVNEPLPLVLDDVLLHFDEPRARAALEVLSDLAVRTQVLFFTHHGRLVELASEAVTAERLVRHRLVRATRAA